MPLVPSDTDLLGGLELGGVPIATVMSSLTGLPALFVRKAPKAYGTRRLAEGADVDGSADHASSRTSSRRGGAARDATRRAA